MDINMNWKGGLIFEGSGSSGFIVQMDSDKSVGGTDSAARPMELIALGLAGCMAMDIISILKKKQQEVTEFKIHAHLDRSVEHPKVFTSAMIEFLLSGRDITQEELVRSIDLSATKYCPGYAMLSKIFPIRLRYSIFDELKQLKSSGEWTRPSE
jgi:putative redox protein